MKRAERFEPLLKPITREDFKVEKVFRKDVFFIGRDGKYYPTTGALQSANKAWLDQYMPYISPITRRGYSDPQVMRADEIAHLRDY